ncbi:concanavalin A-like lectin/glucanase domain-containing protein [Phlyctochytrium arcticum]|nr:concanavalin A-like lectin/glucanase domain-containing protein [Phlyctochytrium arcticum]
MTNTNSSMDSVASAARRGSSVSPLAQASPGGAGRSRGAPPASTEASEQYSSRGNPPVRVKNMRNKPPDYLSESALASIYAGGDQQQHEVAERKLPLYLSLSSTSNVTSANRSSGSSGNDSFAEASRKRLQKIPDLPTQWSTKDKSPSIELSPAANLRVTYTGPGRDDVHAAAVRSNHPIPPQCGLFYYEVSIISKGRDGYIGIGFCGQNVALNRLPGWEENSWGYHGDDGHSFCCSGTGKSYGPIFTTGDVVGCIMNFMDKSVSFTKNGVWLGVAFKNVVSSKGDNLYPSVGMRTPGEIVEANFGATKFKFDIDHFFKEERAKLLSSIQSQPLLPAVSEKSEQRAGASAGQLGESTISKDLVLAYLVHHGYSDTAAAFHKQAVQKQGTNSIPGDAENAMQEDDKFDKGEIEQRKSIRNHLLHGRIDEAVASIQALCPQLLQQDRNLDMLLRCQKFVEMMQSVASPSTGDSKQDEGNTSHMDVDGDDENSITPAQDSDPSRGDRLREALVLGQEIQSEFGPTANEHVWNALVETYSLVAYSDPMTSPVAYLLDPANRVMVADAANSAILAFQSRSPVPGIELMYRQTATVVQELTLLGNGAAAFINVERECLL